MLQGACGHTSRRSTAAHSCGKRGGGANGRREVACPQSNVFGLEDCGMISSPNFSFLLFCRKWERCVWTTAQLLKTNNT